MHPTKIEQVIGMEASERYEYFVRKVADFEQIWGLYDGGWASVADDAGAQAVPFWPEEDFARLCADGVWKGFKPRSIPLDSFFEKWVPGMSGDGRAAAVFPTPRDRAVFVEAASLARDIEKECEQYEE